MAANLNVLFIILAEISLTLIIIIGDYYIFESLKLIQFLNKLIGLSERFTRALLDNSSHCAISIISWSICTYPNLNIYEILATGMIGSLIDLDHFISAKSFQLIDAISLEKRPFLHNTLTLLIINIFIFFVLLYYSSNDKCLMITFLIFQSWFSHHCRDANRRGLWFGSFYTTPPIKTSLYLLILLVQPLLIRYFVFRKNDFIISSIFNLVKFNNSSNNNNISLANRNNYHVV